MAAKHSLTSAQQPLTSIASHLSCAFAATACTLCAVHLHASSQVQLFCRLSASWLLCRFQVERVLESVDAVVYLLDYTKLKTQEEADLLKKLRDINPQLFARLSQRLFFCVNKADAVCGPAGTQHHLRTSCHITMACAV